MSEPRRRYHELDALRGFAMLLGIVLHAALSFTFLPVWPAQDLYQNETVYGFVLHAIHGFRMPVFFLISGFFTAMMWRKRGVKGLVLHRAKRILLPLILGTVVIWPMMIAVVVWGATSKAQREEQRAGSLDVWTAAREGDLDRLRRVIREGADVNERDSLRVSPLEWAALEGHAEAIDLLAEHGADVHARNPQGSTALHAAACFGHTDAARKLVELGAEASVRNNRGDTPLAAARVDMVIVHVIAGILQMEIDGDAVAIRRQETAAYLEALEAPADRGRVVSRLQPSEGDAEIGARGSGALTGGRGRLGDTLLSLYLGATFLPLFHHLWFLYYLLWLVAVFLLALRIRRWVPFRLPSKLVKTPGCLLGWVPLTLLPQLMMTQTFGADTAAGFLPWLPALVYYAIFFGFGALAFGRPEFEERAGRHWPVLIGAAVPILLLGVHFHETGGGRLFARGLASLCAVLYAWLMVLGLIGVFRRFFAAENRRIRYLSDASYWIYLAHLPLVIALQVWVSNWEVHHGPKFLLVGLLTLGLLLLFYEYGVRYTWVGALLNGKKTRPVNPADGVTS